MAVLANFVSHDTERVGFDDKKIAAMPSPRVIIKRGEGGEVFFFLDSKWVKISLSWFQL